MDGAELAPSLKGPAHRPGPGWRHQRALAVINPGPQGWSTGPGWPGSGCAQSHLAGMFFPRCLHAGGSLFTSPPFHEGLRPGHCPPEPTLQGRGSANTLLSPGEALLPLPGARPAAVWIFSKPKSVICAQREGGWLRSPGSANGRGRVLGASSHSIRSVPAHQQVDR